MLLHWSTLQPAGASNLAAVRFASPVRVQSIRVFPTDAIPFALDPGIVARTHPSTFFLEVYLNAQTTSPDAKSKQKALNSLVPTTLAYTGGQMDFAVNMTPDFATRLMIFKGKFESVSLAIYGDLVTEASASISTYEPAPLPAAEHSPLSRSLDPSNSSDPTLLARQLLHLIPGAPPLALVIRLMFCLKPSSEDWGRTEFPYLFADLEPEGDEFNLDNAYKWTTTPVDDESGPEYLEVFARRVAGSEQKDSAYLIAGILRNVASQHPDMARLLMENLDLSSTFDEAALDELTISRLLTAASNADVARGLKNESFMDLLHAVEAGPSVDAETRAVACSLLRRIEGWDILEDSLSNTQANFSRAAATMGEIGLEEDSFGILVETLINHQGLVSALAENPVLPNAQVPPPLSPQEWLKPISHDNFIALVRAYIGVSCVLAIYAWADSLPHDGCREQTLSIIRLWQNLDGYREIVNHLLLLRQMTFRLECMTTDNDPPTQCGVHAEHILVNLAHEPRSFLRKDFVQCILSFEQPLLFINEEERNAMRRMALIADDGLAGAIDELTLAIELPLDRRTLSALELSLVMIQRELGNESEGAWRILQHVWRGETHGLVAHLVDTLTVISRELAPYFSLTAPSSTAQALTAQLFRLAQRILSVIVPLASTCHMTSRSIRTLTKAITEVFVCTDAADMSYNQSSGVWIAAYETRLACKDAVRSLADPQLDIGEGLMCSTILLRTLLELGSQHDSGDLVSNLLQIFCLVDHVLPHSTTEEEHLHWVTSILPNVLLELSSFFRKLDTESKVHLIKRLVNLDQGFAGIGEWILQEELHDLSRILHFLGDQMIEDQHRLLGRHQVLLSLRFIVDLISSPSSISTWFRSTVETVLEISQMLASCFVSFMDNRLSSPHAGQIARTLAGSHGTLNPELRFAIVLALYQSSHDDESPQVSLQLALSILKELPADAIDQDRLRREVGAALFAASETPLTEEIAEAIFMTLHWWSVREDTSVAISATALEQLRSNLSEVLESSDVDRLKLVVSKIRPTSEKAPVALAQLPNTISLSLNDISDLLRPPFTIPSAPLDPTKDEVFNMVAISPPTAFLRSPAVTGLTKTYLNNDFRQLRSLPSTRQNTSRLPSLHVDEFELGASSPSLIPLSSPEVYHSLSLSPTFTA